MMSLLPLPVVQHETQSSSKHAFPYPELQQGESLVADPIKQPLRPLMASNSQGKSEQPEPTTALSPEEQHMRELQNMLNEAQNRTAVVEQEAYDKAYAAGEKAGLLLGEKRAEQMLETMHNIVEDAEQQLEQLKQESVAVVLDISAAVVERVIGSLDDDSQHVLSLATEQAVAVLSADLADIEHLSLAVHQHDLETMLRMCEQHPQWKMRAEQGIERGTCRLISSKQDALVVPTEIISKAFQHIREHTLSQHG